MRAGQAAVARCWRWYRKLHGSSPKSPLAGTLLHLVSLFQLSPKSGTNWPYRGQSLTVKPRQPLHLGLCVGNREPPRPAKQGKQLLAPEPELEQDARRDE